MSLRENIRRAITTRCVARYYPVAAIYPQSSHVVAHSRFRHRIYMRGWNHTNRTKVNRYLRNTTKRNGISPNKARNRASYIHALNSRKFWTPSEDAFLRTNMTESEIGLKLGRSLLAIQRRKHWLKTHGGVA